MNWLIHAPIAVQLVVIVAAIFGLLAVAFGIDRVIRGVSAHYWPIEEDR